MFISPYLPQLTVAWTAYFVAVASPGPATFAIISASVNAGRRGGIALALGVMTGSLIWASLAALGLSALLATWGQALVIMKIAGALYLFWLAFKALRSAMTPNADIATGMDTKNTSLRSLWLRGLTVHLTNPKAVFVWLALVSLGLPHNAPMWVTPLFIGVCFMIGTTTMTSFAIFFSMPAVLGAYKRARRGIEGAMAAFFGFAGIKLLTTQF